MGTLEELAGKLLGGAMSGGQAGQAGAAQTNGAALEHLLGLINNPSVGGLSGLSQKFQSAGLGHLISGWISNGPNPPASAGQVQQALGPDQIAAYAQKLGIPPEQAAGIVAKLLPHIVDHLTPDGSIPSGGINVQSVIGLLKSKLLG